MSSPAHSPVVTSGPPPARKRACARAAPARPRAASRRQRARGSANLLRLDVNVAALRRNILHVLVHQHVAARVVHHALRQIALVNESGVCSEAVVVRQVHVARRAVLAELLALPGQLDAAHRPRPRQEERGARKHGERPELRCRASHGVCCANSQQSRVHTRSLVTAPSGRFLGP